MTSSEPPTAAPSAPDAGYIVVELAGKPYGLEIASVVEAVVLHDITPLFHLPDHLLGVTNIRGRVLPVSSLGTLLGVAPSGSTPTHSGVLMRSSGLDAVFAVEKIITVEWHDSAEMNDLPATASESAKSFFKGVLPSSKKNAEPITIVRTENLFDRAKWSNA